MPIRYLDVSFAGADGQGVVAQHTRERPRQADIEAARRRSPEQGRLRRRVAQALRELEHLVETHYVEWQTIAGLLIPARQETRSVGDEDTHFVTVDSVTINPSIEDDRFHIPVAAGNGSGGREQPRGKPFDEPWMLVDLSADPGEKVNVAEIFCFPQKTLTSRFWEQY